MGEANAGIQDIRQIWRAGPRNEIAALEHTFKMICHAIRYAQDEVQQKQTNPAPSL